MNKIFMKVLSDIFDAESKPKPTPKKITAAISNENRKLKPWNGFLSSRKSFTKEWGEVALSSYFRGNKHLLIGLLVSLSLLLLSLLLLSLLLLLLLLMMMIGWVASEAHSNAAYWDFFLKSNISFDAEDSIFLRRSYLLSIVFFSIEVFQWT